jgi:hypothetical protein
MIRYICRVIDGGSLLVGGGAPNNRSQGRRNYYPKTRITEVKPLVHSDQELYSLRGLRCYTEA